MLTIIICRQKLCLGDIMCILHIVFDNYYLQIITQHMLTVFHVLDKVLSTGATKMVRYSSYYFQKLIFVEGNKTWGSAYYTVRAITGQKAFYKVHESKGLNRRTYSREARLRHSVNSLLLVFWSSSQKTKYSVSQFPLQLGAPKWRHPGGGSS